MPLLKPSQKASARRLDFGQRAGQGVVTRVGHNLEVVARHSQPDDRRFIENSTDFDDSMTPPV
jgi:hypothetical protein